MLTFFTKFCFAAALLGGLAYGQIPTPSILSVARSGGDAISIQWKVDDPQGALKLTRYRVQVSTDDFKTSSEWPAQIKRVNYDSANTTYKQMTTDSNFDCFNECLKDTGCGFVTRSSKQSGDNCFLKATVKNPTNTSLDADSEYVLIDDYSSNTTLRYISSGLIYSFKVAVYDSKTNVWSQFSNKYGFNFKSDLGLRFIRNGKSSGKLVWNNNGFTFSRFNVYTSENASDTVEVPNINSDALETYQSESNYFSIQNFTDYTIVQSLTECITKCLKLNECVQLVHFTADYLWANGTVLAPKSSCFTNSKVDVQNAFYKKADINILSVRNTYQYFEYLYIEWNNWRFEIEPYTTYGVSQKGVAVTTYNLTDGAPSLKSATLTNKITVAWKSSEPLNFTRFGLYYFVNSTNGSPTYYIEESSNYNDSNQTVVTAKDINECFEACFNMTECLAYVFVEETSECELKTNLENQTECLNTTICAIMPQYRDTVTINSFYNTDYCMYAYLMTSFNYTTPPGYLICTGIKSIVSVQQIDTFYPGRDARIRCLPIENNKRINWYRNLEPLDLDAMNASITDDNTTITFHKVSGALNNGVYNCENVLNNTQVMSSVNMLKIQVNETAPPVPSRPQVQPAGSYEKPSIIISWEYDPYILPVKRINLFYSTDRSNFKNKTFESDTLSSGIIIIEEKFDCKTTFKFVATNAIGDSATSDPFEFNQEKCKESPQEDPKTDYFTAFIVTVSVAGVFVIIILGVLIRKCTKPRPRRSSITLR